MNSKLKKADAILAKVLIDNIKRYEAGNEKYGGSMVDNHKSILEWIRDAKEEAMDFVVYLTKLEMLLIGDHNPDTLVFGS